MDANGEAVASGGFAIIDFETTGLSARLDRVVEVAVVHTDPAGRVTGMWETLVNPGRDLGAQHIHAITAAEVMSAPTFAEIAPRLVELLSGRVVVAHNASFDTRFLMAELDRSGYRPGVEPESLCTMRLAREFLPGASRSLRDCCAALDIDLTNAHRASADALATASLLAHYIAADPKARFWREMVADAAQRTWPPLAMLDADWVAREAASALEPSFLQRIAGRMPDHSGPDDHSDYLALLDRCLLDRTISRHEAAELVALADELGIGREQCAALNAQYFGQLAAVAWEDRVLTVEERADLSAVAALLEIPASTLAAALERPVDAAPAAAHAPFVLRPGDRVVLTGEMSRSREAWEAALDRAGLVPWAAVTKRVKVVAAADVDSLSGKARKARDYGIPVVDEATLARLIPG